jgi:hypothetical protein
MVEVKPQREKCQYHTDSPPVNVRAVEAKLGAEEGLQETRRLASVGIGKRAVNSGGDVLKPRISLSTPATQPIASAVTLPPAYDHAKSIRWTGLDGVRF